MSGAGEARRRALARLELAGSALCFGLMAVLARRLSRGPGAFTAGHLSVVRFAVGALVSLGVFRLRPGLYRPSNYRLLVSRGISGGLVVVLYFAALSRIPAGEAGLLYNLFPILATGMSFFAFGERPTVHLIASLVAATCGVALVLGEGALRVGAGWGEAAALAAAVFAATSAITIRSMRGTDNAPTIFFWFCLAGLPVVLPFALDPWPALGPAWAVAVAMALCAFAAQVLMTEAYGALSVSEAAVWLQLTPIAQYALALPLLGEKPGLPAVLGAALAVGGVAYGTVRGGRPAPAVAVAVAPATGEVSRGR
ncbi:MAG TPA: DMT family transporter [Anaeromyxobacteraceae bacterium]|jgi:drug/metabolite transporter (DMT)-like permease|nr:DMT family transporter [Anaeromyxobacteraceae bacterium]